MRLTPGGAKHFEEIAGLPFTVLVYEFDKTIILRKDTTAFLEFFDVDRIARARLLHRLFGKVMFLVDGFNDDDRALHEIAEVRDFLQKLVSEWPYFLFAASLEENFLRELIWCMLPNLTSTTHPEDSAKYIVKFSPKAANQAYQKLLHPFSRLCARDPSMNQAKFDARISDVQAMIRKNTIS